MRIVLKPMGAVAVMAAVVCLSIMAFTNQRKQAETVANPEGTTLGTKTVASLLAQVMYGDGFENSWELYGWAKEIIPNASNTVHEGSTAIQAVLKPYEGVKLHHQLTTFKNFDRISFFVYCDGDKGRDIQVGAEKTTLLKAVNIDPLPYRQWVSVTIPLKDLGVKEDGLADAFWVKEATGKTIPVLILDDVRLLAPDDSVPRGPSRSYSAVRVPAK